ncbi:agglutinin biogenesis protein MshK [Pseudoalteromonas sp. MMG010]|uniref:agglutinin biogenesis protein MshK n=1 Tax=Pseudoalteromonas sp. MMG010 TaxID=2822685 RepID=UPI001B3A4C61|nr:agglutinin biogenesis protein MshK [Pseudoalteromonas sp. MMG010]MBQ4832649.1 agglutinin biogenesis protein MshK [Pseudoalteromonas sp. MMG010]
MKHLLFYNVCLAALCLGANCFASQLLDPTKPPTQRVIESDLVNKTTLKLQTIIKTSTAYKAIISGTIYQVGDTVNNLRVLTITAKQVVLANNDKQIKLDLYHYEIKK